MVAKILIAVVAVALLVGTVMADEPPDRIAVKPIIGASIGSVQMGENSGDTRISYWGGVYLKQVTKSIALWGVYQNTQLESMNLTGSGGKALFTVTHKKYPDATLLIGGGWLDDFALESDGVTRTAAFTFDMGLLYEWWWDQVFVGALITGVDYGPRMDWSIDLGTVVRF